MSHCSPLRSVRAALEVGEGGLIGGDHAGARAALDAHVAERHAALHGERADGCAGVLDGVAGAAVGADLVDDAEREILGGDALRQASPSTLISIDLGTLLLQGLRGQHVLDFAGADAEGEGSKGAVRAGVAVAADDGLAG